MLTLRRPEVASSPPVELDAVQRAAVAHRGPVLRVMGAPGTGKTTLAVEIVAARVASGAASPDQCLVLTSDRRAAGALRERVTARLGGTSTDALARTHQAFGYALLRRVRALAGEPAPRLLSGPEQDVILRELLEGHAQEGTGPAWPPSLRLALPTRGFRGQLRDLLMRAVELGLDPVDLAALGEREGRPEWVAAAQVLDEYDQVTALSESTAGAYDPAWILGAAADLLEESPDLLEQVRGELRLVVVDDAQELTPAAFRLLRVVIGEPWRPGAPELVLLGDPDAATQTFRGADPRVLAHEWVAFGDGVTLSLPTAYRLPEAIREVATRVTGHIGVTGPTAHRRAQAGRPGGLVEVHLLRAVAQEAAQVAAILRRAHLLEGVAWDEMAVIVRGQARTSTLRRVLQSQGVPVAAAQSDVPVRDEVAVRPLLALLRAVCDLAFDRVGELDPEMVVDVLASPIGGGDAVTIRRLRRALRAEELAGGGGRVSDLLLAEAVLQPAKLVTLGPEAGPARRVAAVLQAGLGAARTMTDPMGRRLWAPGVTAEAVLWAMWSATGLADPWRSTALAGGVAGARADRDLDAVVALFDAAARFTDRLPGAGPEQFLSHVEEQDIPGDSLAGRASERDCVALLTPAAAAGRSWRLVVVAGVQEGVWPDLRLRGSLLGSAELVDLVTGRQGGVRAAQAAVRHDETRLFLVAVTRASERLVVTAVRSEDEQPSPYLDVVDPLPSSEGEQGRAFSDVGFALSLPSVVALLRRDVVDADPSRRAAAVNALARLAREGVPGADPGSWWALTTLSDDRPRRAPGAEVQVSPSNVEGFGICQLNWALTRAGGEGPSIGSATLGTLLHGIAEDHPHAELPILQAELTNRWRQLGLRDGWLTERTRRQAEAMVTRLSAYFRAAEQSGWRALALEAAVKVALGRVVLRGSIDRVEAGPDGSVRVIDFKSGGSKPREADLARHPQLGAYQIAVSEGGIPALEGQPLRNAGAQLVHIGKAAGKAPFGASVQTPLADDPNPRWAHDLLLTVGEGMAGATFEATPGPRCPVCPVRTCCPALPEGRSI